MAILDRFRRLWNAFTNQPITFDGGTSVSGNYRSSGFRYRYSNDKTIVTSVYTRIAMDVSGVLIKHVLLDENGRYKDDAPSQLNRCLMLEANIDQAPQAFRQDIAMTLFENGTAAIVPIASERDPLGITIRDVSNMRVGDVTEFLTQHVRLNVWNEAVGRRQEIVMSKKLVAIVNNPLSAIMNEPNSTLQRLIRKLSLLDTVDEASSSGKLDLIIQLPYTVKTEIKRQQAEQRRELIETQLKGSQYGIAYADATEKITQLNRPAENNLLKQVEYLVDMLYSQLGITPEVMNGTADEATMINYYGRTIYPIVVAIVEAMNRTFLDREKVGKSEIIRYFREPFKFVTMTSMADISDKLRRNEIMTSNEIRDVMFGMPPSKEAQADQLANPNMPQQPNSGVQESERDSQNGS